MEEHTNDITQLLARLHEVSGGEYARLVEQIAHRGEFHPLSGEAGIFITGGQQHDDFTNLLAAAKKGR